MASPPPSASNSSPHSSPHRLVESNIDWGGLLDQLREGTLPGFGSPDPALTSEQHRKELAELVETALQLASGRTDDPSALLRAQVIELLSQDAPPPDADQATRPSLRLLDALARLGEHLDESELWQAALARLVDWQTLTRARVAAGDRYAQFLFDRMGEISLSVDSWKSAAREAHTLEGSVDVERNLWQKALASSTDDTEAAEGLIRCCLAVGDWSPIPLAFPTLLHQAAAPGDLATYAHLLLDLQALAATHTAGRDYSSLVDEVLWSASSESGVPIDALMRAKARVLAADPQTSNEAANAYQALLESSATHQDIPEYVAFIEQHPDRAWQHDQFARLFEWRAARAANPDAILLDWARLEEVHFADLAAARALVERVLSENPASLPAHRQLVHLCRIEEDVGGLETALAQLAEQCPDDERNLIHLERAAILVDHLNQPFEAVALLAKLVDLRHITADLQSLLIRLLSTPDRALRLRAAKLLIDTTSADTLSAAEVDMVFAAHAATRDADTDLAEPLLSFEAQTIRRGGFERLLSNWTGDPARGFSAAVEAVTEHPSVPGFWNHLETLGLKLSNPASVIETYRTVLEHSTDPHLAEQLGQQLLRFAESASLDPDSILPALLAVLHLSPQSRWALDRVKLRFGALGRWVDLLSLYDSSLSVTTASPDRIALLTEAAVTAKDLAGDGIRAIDYYEELSLLIPTDPRIESSLERLYERHNLLHRQIAHLSQHLSTWSGSELHRVLQRLAVLCMTAGQARAAWDAIQHGLLADAAWPAAIDLLERLVVLPAARTEPAEPTTAELAGNLLCEHYARQEAHLDLVRVLRELLSFLGDSKRRMSLLEELGATLELRLLDTEAAFATVAELLSRDADNAEYRVWIARLAESPGNANRYVDALCEAADHARTLEGQAALLTDAAYWCSEKLADTPRALTVYQRLADSAGDWTELATSSLLAMDRLLRPDGDASRRCDVHERLALLFTEPPKQVAAHRTAARIAATELSDPQRAARSWSQLLAIIPTDTEALNGLVDALSHTDDYSRLVEALELRVAASHDPDLLRRDRHRIAQLLLHNLEQPAQAIAMLRGLLDDDPTDLDAHNALASALERHGLWSELVTLLESSLLQTKRPASIYRRLADIHLNRTHNLRAAVLALLGAGDPLAAANVIASSTDTSLDDVTLTLNLADSLLGASHLAEAAAVLGAQIGHFGDRKPRERSLVHHRLALTLLALNRPEDALHEMDAAVLIDPSNPLLLDFHGRLALQLEALDCAEQSYRSLLLLALHPGAPNPELPARSELYFRLSRIAAKRGDADRTNELIASAFDATLGDEREIVALEQALLQDGQDELLLQVLDRRLETTLEIHEASTFLAAFTSRRLAHGDLTPAMLARLRDRADRLCSSLQDSSNPSMAWQSHRALVDLYRLLGDTDCILTLLMSLSARFADSEVGFELQVEAAKLMLEQKERCRDGVDLLLELWRKQPTRDDLGRLLATAFNEDGRSDELIPLLQDQIDTSIRAGELDRADAVSLQMAGVLRDHGDIEGASLLCGSVVAHAGNLTRQALWDLETLLESQLPHSSDRLTEVLSTILELESGRPAARAAEILSRVLRELGDEPGAKRALALGFAQDPTYPKIRAAVIDDRRRSGDLQGALHLAESSFADTPDDASLHLLLLDIYEQAQRLDDALLLAQKLWTQTPSDLALASRCWRLLTALGRPEEALETAALLRNTPGVEPLPLANTLHDFAVQQTDARWLHLEVDLLLEAGSDAQAMDRLAIHLDSHPTDGWALRRQANLAESRGDWTLAAQRFEQLLPLADTKDAIDAAVGLAAACAKLGFPAKARSALVGILRTHPESQILLDHLRNCFDSDESPAELGQLYAELAPRQSNAAQAMLLWEMAGNLLLEAGRPAEALNALTNLVAHPPPLRTQLQKSRCLAALGRHTEAVALLETTAQSAHFACEADRVLVYRRLGELHLDNDDLLEAAEALTHAHRLDRSHLPTAYQLGLLAVDLDDFATAATALRVIASTPRDSEPATALSPEQRCRAFIELGRIQLDRGSHHGARQLFARALEEDPNNPTALGLLLEL